MKRLGVLLISLFFFFQSTLLAYSINPKEFVNELVNDAISKLSDKNLNEDQKSSFIEKIALENVDINALGLYTLGELRKSSNKDDIFNYQISFKKYFLKSLTSRLTDYSASKFEISIGKTAELISKLMGVDIEIESDSERVRPTGSEVNRLFGSNEKILTLTDWKPSFQGLEGFKQGLQLSIEWFTNLENLKLYKSNYAI